MSDKLLKIIEKDIYSNDNSREFQIRLLKDEGVGLLTDKNGDSYLILDSIDYWYDVKQNHSPQKQKCSCKCDWFNILFRYCYRDDSRNIREVHIITTCTNCKKTAIRMSVDIKYSPTDQLVSQPITFCENPNLRYKLSNYSALWTPCDLERFLRFLYDELNMTAYDKYAEAAWYLKPMTFEETIKKTTKRLYITQKPIVSESEKENSLFFEREPWRKGEIIEFSSINIHGLGLMYFITFCTQYIDKGHVKEKPKEFSLRTAQLAVWLKDNFITKRCKNCFDSEEMYQKFMESKVS